MIFFKADAVHSCFRAIVLSSLARACALTLHGYMLLLAVLSSLTACCTKIPPDDSIVCTMPLLSGRRRKPKVENWTDFAPCCLCCGRYCSRARCAHFWRQQREMPHRLFLSWDGVQRRSQNVTEEGWKRVRHSKPVRVDADQPRPRDKLQQEWLECKSGTHSGGIPPR